MMAWWTSLTPLNQSFYALALFFSLLFIWQFVSALSALGDGGDATGDQAHTPDTTDHPPDGDTSAMGHGDSAEHQADGSHGLATFRLLSIRSILAFGMLFSWGGALYLQNSIFPSLALLRAGLWGVAGMVVVALFFWALPRLTESGTANLDTAIGRTAQVYINIPEDGVGQVKVLVSGVVSFVRARSLGGQPIPAGTTVRVLRRVDDTTLEVDPSEV